MLTLHQLSYRPKESRFCLRVEEFGWDGKGVLALVGNNGSGKSTLMSLIAGLKKPDTGTSSYAGYNTYFSYDQIKFRLPLVSWDIPLNPQLKPRIYINMVSALAPKWNKDLELRLREEFSIPMDQNIGSFSRGEQAKLKILLASCCSPDIMLIDELTSDLDTDSRKKIFNFLDEQVFSECFGLIWASNVMSDVEKYATHIFILSKGQFMASGELDAFKLRHQKVALHCNDPQKKPTLDFIKDDRLSWDGRTGLLHTRNFDKRLENQLNAEGVSYSLLPYSLAEIVHEYGE